MLSTNNVKIPQNSKSFFVIKRGSWKNSIDIVINNHEIVDLGNLYLILKSYVLDASLGLIAIKIISYDDVCDDHKKVYTYSSVDIRKLSRMNIREFTDWFDDLYGELWRYIDNVNKYGIRLVMESKISNIDRVGIYPIYPWQSNFKKLISADSKWLDKISQLQREIENLKRKLKNGK